MWIEAPTTLGACVAWGTRVGNCLGNPVTAIDYIRKGKLGKIVHCRAWIADGTKIGKGKVSDVPRSLDYDAWIAEQYAIALANQTPEGLGKVLTVKNGCIGCHSVDGAK